MKKTSTLNFKKIIGAIAVSMIITTVSTAQNNAFWKSAPITSFNISQERTVFPEKFLAYQLDLAALRSALSVAPKEYTVDRNKGLIMSFPLPDGTFSRYSIVETKVMHPALSAKYPLIKTYVAQGIDDVHAWMRLDLSYLGFHAMLSTVNGYVFIDPVNSTELENYICYNKSDMPNAYERHCELKGSKSEEESLVEKMGTSPSKGNLKIHDTGDELRTYRLAMACTGEYAATKGGTVPGALSGIVTSVNRVNGIYETEVAVRMVLIANTDTLIFLNAGSDPYSNNNGGAMLGQNQTTVTNRIGASNYDFGHVFSTGGGGIAGLGVICNNSQKANGVTGLPNPVGDAFDVDYVAHEMGHQFGANHTFNNNSAGSCSGNASQGHNFEPGSGSTIMAYASLCSPFDLQNHSDPIFHTESYNEIFNYTIFSAGNSCAAVSFTNNSVPVINPLNDYIIPFKTPFVLTGSATDFDGDPMTYIWEQYDSGPFGNPNTPSGDAAIFRDWMPVVDSSRTFPRLISIINNTTVLGEKLPTYARTMHFRFTARDNRTGGGGVANNFTPVVVDVINTTNPFLVTDPNVGSVLWHFGANELVTWDVSSTDLAPINCANVNILLSIDGGFTFPYTLAANTPNDGSETVLIPTTGGLPQINTNQARIKVQSVGNIFFDMSNANFSIQIPNGVESVGFTANALNVFPNPSDANVTLELNSAQSGKLVINITDCLGRIVYSEEVVKNNTKFKHSLNLDGLEKGIYFVEVKSGKSAAAVRFVKL